MRIGQLYEQAVALTPRAARIAAQVLLRDDDVPEDLRRSLCILLSACAGNSGDLAVVRWAPGDRDAAAAQRFVAACRSVNRQLRQNH